jgi:molybdopterin-guanine dinucleotide biosynthesis protein A
MIDDTPADTTLGILAGGRARRLGGVDKAWLSRDGVPQVLRIARRFAHEVDATLVSANHDAARYAACGLDSVEDAVRNAGPIGGLDALARTSATTWLLTIPVDVVGVNECLLQTLQACAGGEGAFAVDEDGLQPLVALWMVASLRKALPAFLAAGDHAVQDLQRQLGMHEVRFAGVRFGNLNTPADLAAAGVQ